MYFYLPTKVFFSDRVLEKHGLEFTKYGTKALLVTGQSSARKSGVLKDLFALLSNLNFKYCIFDQVTENPDLSIITKGADFCIHNQCDMIIAIGGGSSLDAGKAISLMSANNLESTELYSSLLYQKALPIIAIPTTSGTGSEVTQYCVLNNAKNNIKAGFGHELMMPKIAFLDPQYTLTLPYITTRDTAIDALSHLLEGLYSRKYSEFLLPFILSGAKLIYDHLQSCLSDLQNLYHRKALMLAANYGGIVIAHSSTTLQHAIGYPLTTEYGLTHGLANGVVMKMIMQLFKPSVEERLNLLFHYLNTSESKFLSWLELLDIKFNGNITEEFLQNRVPEVMNSRNMAFNPFTVTENQVIYLYRNL